MVKTYCSICKTTLKVDYVLFNNQYKYCDNCVDC